MPVRTTTVVASGLVVLTLVGVGTIFGESLAALVTPGPAADGNAAARTGPPGQAAAAPSPTAASAVPGKDAGGNASTTAGAPGPTPDGSS